MHVGKEREWVKEAYSIVLMQMHVNMPGNTARESDTKQHRIRGKRLTKGEEKIGGE